jgi:hypothetical protein
MNEEALAHWGLLGQKQEKYVEGLLSMTDQISVLFGLQLLICYVFQRYITCDFIIHRPRECVLAPARLATPPPQKKAPNVEHSSPLEALIVLTTNLAHMTYLQAM